MVADDLGPHPEVGAKGAFVEVERAVFIGPMRAGFRVGMERLLRDGLLGWQHLWADHPETDFGWHGTPLVKPENGLRFDVDIHSGAGMPDTLAVLSIPRNSASARAAGILQELDDCLSPLEVERLELRFFEFGMATVSIDATGHGLRLAESDALRWVEQRSSRIPAETGILAFCRESLTALDAWVPAEYHSTVALWHDEAGVWDPGEVGQVLWIHRVAVFRRKGGDVPIPGYLLPSSAGEPLVYEHQEQHLTVVPGVGSSTVVADAGPSAAIVDPLVRIVSMQEAYWAAARELGSALLRRANEMTGLRTSGRTARIRREAYALVELHDEAALFRALMSDRAMALPPFEAELWKRLAQAWNLAELFDQIEERQRTLADLGDRFLTRVQDDTSRTLNTAVFALTLISSVGVVAALIDFSQDGRLAPPTFSRAVALVIIAAILAVLTAVVFSIHRMRRPRQPTIPPRRISTTRSGEGDTAGPSPAAAHGPGLEERPVKAGPTPKS
jgi:hypothetical protein